MCRWLSYSGAPIFLEKLIFEPEFSLIAQSLHARKAAVATNGDGFGVGWYGERPIPGLYRDILPAWADPNLKSLAHQIRAKMFFAHVRASTGTATSRANCHPFSQGRWLFMHNGQIGGYDRIRRRLDALIPDDLYAKRAGTTDSELIFLALFRFGLDQDPAAALRRTVAEIGDAMASAAITEPFRMTAALSDGCNVWAVRYATDETPPSLFFCSEDEQRLIVSEPLDGDSTIGIRCRRVICWSPTAPDGWTWSPSPPDPAIRLSSRPRTIARARMDEPVESRYPHQGHARR